MPDSTTHTTRTARRSDFNRLSTGPVESLTRPCETCGIDVTHGVAPVGTTFGDIMRSHAFFCDGCIAAKDQERRLLDEQRAAERLASKAQWALKEASLPPIFAHATFETCRTDGIPELAVTAAERWAAGSISGLMLVGPVGVGKSTLAAAALRTKISRDGRRAHWKTAPLLFAELGSGFDNPTRDRALDVLQKHGGLVLDDIDKGRPTPYGAEMTFLAIDQRVTYQAPLLVTANSGLDGLSERWPEEYSDAIVSRLVGHCEIVAIDGEDRRISTGKIAA